MSAQNVVEDGPGEDRESDYASLQAAVAQALAAREALQTSAPRAETLDKLAPAIGTGLLARRIGTSHGQLVGIFATGSPRGTGT